MDACLRYATPVISACIGRKKTSHHFAVLTLIWCVVTYPSRLGLPPATCGGPAGALIRLLSAAFPADLAGRCRLCYVLVPDDRCHVGFGCAGTSHATPANRTASSTSTATSRDTPGSCMVTPSR